MKNSNNAGSYWKVSDSFFSEKEFFKKPFLNYALNFLIIVLLLSALPIGGGMRSGQESV